MKISGIQSLFIALALLGLFIYSYMDHNYSIAYDPDAKNEYSLDSLKFRTSHSQFHIYDREFLERDFPEIFWSDTSFKRKLSYYKGVIGVHMFSYGSAGANVVLEIRDKENKDFEMDKYDHIVEADLGIESGKLIITPCLYFDAIIEKKLYPSNYRVRVYTSEINEQALEIEADEKYKIEIWPDEKKGPILLKKYKS